jgi:hypothetical protein
VNIKIKNKKTYQGEGFYIGRPSPLGNPFRITKTQTREDAIRRYSIWLKEQILHNPDILKTLDGLFSHLINNQSLTLVCWCSPESCHGDVIKQFLLNKYYHGEYIIKGD